MSDYVGEFEQMVLLSIVRLGDDAYGLSVRRELQRVAGRKPSSGSLYTTLDRLEKKGLIVADARDGGDERGGRPRRYVTVTEAGQTALADSRSRLLALWDGIEGVLDR